MADERLVEIREEVKRAVHKGNPIRTDYAAELLAEVTRLRTEATRPTGEEDTDLARIADVGVRRIDATNGRLEMDLTVSQEVMCILAEGAMKILDSSGAENYVEMQMRVPSRPEMVTLTVQRWEGRTPHQMRQQAEAEVAALRARLDRAEGIEAAARNAMVLWRYGKMNTPEFHDAMEELTDPLRAPQYRRAALSTPTPPTP